VYLTGRPDRRIYSSSQIKSIIQKVEFSSGGGDMAEENDGLEKIQEKIGL
jgi:hypothetical protein